MGSYAYTATVAGRTLPHAVGRTGNGWTFAYDANGNMTKRVEGTTTFTQAYNVDNRLTAITRTGGLTLTQQYDADGARVRKTEGATTTLYIGAAVEVQIRGATRVTTTYYFFGSQRVAMRVTTGTITGTVTWLHGDHLGSASLATNASGAKVAGSDARYTPFGEYRTGLAGAGNASDNRFTGQKRLTAGWGLDDFNARMYSAALARFVSADTIVPGAGEPQALNRFSYVFNRVLGLIDPSGHGPCAGKSGDDFWQCRWYTAHGYSHYQGRGWVVGGDATFEDFDILNDVMTESGFRFTSGNKAWDLPHASLVGSGIVALAHKVGSSLRLRELVGNTIHNLVRITGDLFTAVSGAPARTEPQLRDSPIYFADGAFGLADADVRGLAVHEVFHLIEYNWQSWARGIGKAEFTPMRAFPRTAKLSGYAMENRLGLEYWAEAGADWVYGQTYSYTRRKEAMESLTPNQAAWLSNVLTGWGW